MKHYLEAGLLTVLVATAGCSNSSTPASTPTAAARPAASSAKDTAPPTASTPLTLSADDAAKLKAWIMSQNTASTDVPGMVMIGTQLSLGVPLHEIPASVGVSTADSNEYAIINGMTVLVNSNDYKVVYVFG